MTKTKSPNQQLVENVRKVLARDPVRQAQLQAVFTEVVQEIHRFVKGRSMKVFEVHHLIDVARAAFLQAFADGRTDQDCYMCGLAAVNLWNPLCLAPPPPKT
jgi:hypothetical protein